MSKFNKTTTGIDSKTDTVNQDNFPAFSRTSFKQEVASVVLNTMLNGDSFYEKNRIELQKLKNLLLIIQITQNFLQKLWCIQEMKEI